MRGVVTLERNAFGGYWNVDNHAEEYSESEAQWLVSIGRAVIRP